ncbi:MAG: SIR2 family protein [Bdellovibrionales bacterium]|nr:SIR2 family protein [Bdellovibrionales bacterium]
MKSNGLQTENYLKISSDSDCKTLFWNKGSKKFKIDNNIEQSPLELRKKIEPWLTALFQSERLNLLIGSGLTIAQEHLVDKTHTDFMETLDFNVFPDQIKKTSEELAKRNGRELPNIEDQLNVANTLLAGLEIYAKEDGDKTDLEDNIKKLKTGISKSLKDFITKILSLESKILSKRESVARYLIPFLMSFASRTLSRERLHIFTTNYDRVIEWGADLTGLRLIDRFVGNIEPIFRASRLNIDMHYNPPGIRGEPRYLEGVAYFTKLHGSLDWNYRNGKIQRIALPFGGNENTLPLEEQCLIYPHSAKEWQTANYPYSELFRDFATAVCRPNTTLVTYGYGFGDEHINRIIEDMLTIPSTHLVIISYDITPKMHSHFCENQSSKKEQISVLVGPELADIKSLVRHYLPKSAIDHSMKRMFEIKKQRDEKPELSIKDEGSDKDPK